MDNATWQCVGELIDIGQRYGARCKLCSWTCLGLDWGSLQENLCDHICDLHTQAWQIATHQAYPALAEWRIFESSTRGLIQAIELWFRIPCESMAHFVNTEQSSLEAWGMAVDTLVNEVEPRVEPMCAYCAQSVGTEGKVIPLPAWDANGPALDYIQVHRTCEPQWWKCSYIPHEDVEF